MTEAVPWVKWRFDRWRSDEGLRMCGLPARGLWIELLSIMHGCKPYGHLAVKGRAPTDLQIASMVGMTTEKEVRLLLVELEDAGVFSRSDKGLIYCRRMVRDNSAREKGRTFGLTGGNPILTKQDKPIERDHDKPNGEKGLTPPFKTEKREERERRDSVLRTGADAPPDARDILWQQGLPIIRSLVRQSETQSRAFLGKMLAAARDDCARVLKVILEAQSLRPANPAAWLMKSAVPQNERDLLHQDPPKPSPSNPQGRPISPMSGTW